jgi:hypothetical protein
MKAGMTLVAVGVVAAGVLAAAALATSPPPKNAHGPLTKAEVNDAQSYAEDAVGDLKKAEPVFAALPQACAYMHRPNVPARAVADYRHAIALELDHLDTFVDTPMDDLRPWANGLPARAVGAHRAHVHEDTIHLLLGISHISQASGDLFQAGKGFRMFHCNQATLVHDAEELGQEGDTQLKQGFAGVLVELL